MTIVLEFPPKSLLRLLFRARVNLALIRLRYVNRAKNLGLYTDELENLAISYVQCGGARNGFKLNKLAIGYVSSGKAYQERNDLANFMLKEDK